MISICYFIKFDTTACIAAVLLLFYDQTNRHICPQRMRTARQRAAVHPRPVLQTRLRAERVAGHSRWRTLCGSYSTKCPPVIRI